MKDNAIFLLVGVLFGIHLSTLSSFSRLEKLVREQSAEVVATVHGQTKAMWPHIVDCGR